MEIIDYLRIVRKRIALFLIVPLLAGGAAAAYVLSQPTTYTATATVSSATLVGGNSVFTGPQATSQFVAAYSAAATGPQVVQAVAAGAGVGVVAVRNGISMHQSGASSDMVVSYVSTRKNTVQTVLSQDVKQTLDAMFKPRAAAALQQRDAALASMKDASTAVAAYAKKVGMADPMSDYQATLNLLNTLTQQRYQLRANANYVGAAGLDAPIKAAQAKLAAFGPILSASADLVATQHAAEQDLATAQAQYRQAQSLLQASQSPDVAFYTDTQQVDVTGDLLTLVLPVFVAGLLLAFVLVIALEMLRGAKRSPAAHAGPGAASSLRSGTESRLEGDPASGGPELEDGVQAVQGAQQPQAEGATPEQDDTEVAGVEPAPATAADSGATDVTSSPAERRALGHDRTAEDEAVDEASAEADEASADRVTAGAGKSGRWR